MKGIFPYLKPYVPRMSVGVLTKFLGTVVELLIFIFIHILCFVDNKHCFGYSAKVYITTFYKLACVFDYIF